MDEWPYLSLIQRINNNTLALNTNKSCLKQHEPCLNKGQGSGACRLMGIKRALPEKIEGHKVGGKRQFSNAHSAIPLLTSSSNASCFHSRELGAGMQTV
eukprot:1160941-Pelagomonas_calceolata.AAC.9